MKLREVSKIAYNQWHFERNKRLDPETISSTSREIVYWQCKKENKHVWASYVYAKIDNDIECPLCINKEVHNSGPELLSVEREFNGSRKNIYYILNTWYCRNCKNIWQTESGDTIPTNTYCTNCFGEETLENCFAEEYPELAEEWAIDNILPATEVLSYFPLDVNWKCKICNNIWNSKVEERRFGLKSCPYCAKKLPLPGIDSFMALYPDIAEEWAYEANETRHPDAIFPDNRITPIRWRCKKCCSLHVASIFDKIHGINGCNNCISEQPISAERYIFLKSEFQSSSGDIKVFDLIMPDYTAPLKWLCQGCNEIFIFSMKERYFEARDCACAEGKKAIPGKTSFKALYPELASEFSLENNLDPDAILPTYTFSGVWDCKTCGLSWNGTIKDRIDGKVDCPYCNGSKAIPGKTSFKALYPKMAEECLEISEKDLDNILPTSCILPIKWRCPECYMIWRSFIKERVTGKVTCPYCSGKKAIPGKTSFKALYPKIAAECSEINEADLDNILPTYSLPITWDCSTCAMTWKGSIKARVDGNAICPYCSGKKAIPGKTSFKALYPEMAAEYSLNNEVSSDTILSTYSLLVEWDCPVCNMTWKGSVKDRVNEEIDCPYCNGREAIQGKTSFKTLHVDMMKEWHFGNWLFIDPDNIIEDYSGNVWWTCSKCQNSYSMSPKKKLYYQKRKKEPCPYCKGRHRKMHHFL